MCLVSHVISQDHVIKESCDFVDENPSWKVTTLLSISDHSHFRSGYIVALVCHVILQVHAI